MSNIFVKIVLWLVFVLVIYFLVYKSIRFFDPANTNLKGIKTLSSFVAILFSYFFGSYLAQK
ncbi:MAG: hypothetical protein CMG09_01095 [Candidatus Marinimicrobia bacterium]|nr:hypothetical protein [Candidatus Neomarinimicrobiota bacterium]